MASQKPVLVTLTSPSCAGKSYLFNYIRDVAKLPCLISTTTRARRTNEIPGIDYHFISMEESIRLEKENRLAELAIYNGVRYGVTKQEFENKLACGIAFLIVEPTGIDHYVQPALDMGAFSYKTFIHTDPEVRLERFRDRAQADMLMAVNLIQTDSFSSTTSALNVFETYMNRLTTMLTIEMQWAQAHKWDRILFGDQPPKDSLAIILNDIKKIRERELEIEKFNQDLSDSYFFS